MRASFPTLLSLISLLSLAAAKCCKVHISNASTVCHASKTEAAIGVCIDALDYVCQTQLNTVTRGGPVVDIQAVEYNVATGDLHGTCEAGEGAVDGSYLTGDGVKVLWSCGSGAC